MTEHMSAERLVGMLIEQSLEPGMGGAEAIDAWYVQAAEHGDTELCRSIERHGRDRLAKLWDGGQRWTIRDHLGRYLDTSGEEQMWRCDRTLASEFAADEIPDVIMLDNGDEVELVDALHPSDICYDIGEGDIVARVEAA